MRISDWSSDLCSSDLRIASLHSNPASRSTRRPSPRGAGEAIPCACFHQRRSLARTSSPVISPRPGGIACNAPDQRRGRSRIDRQRGGEGKSVCVRVDLGGLRRIIKKKKKKERK